MLGGRFLTSTKGSAMTTGIISRLVKDRGFGFIRSSGGHELFFHRSQVRGVAFELLTQGQGTVFNVALGTKGLQAIDVKLLAGVTAVSAENNSLKKGASSVEQKASRVAKLGSILARPIEPAKEKAAV